MHEDKDKDRAKTLENNALNRPRMSVFKNDAFANFVHKKTERITTALYLITNLLPKEEPIKWRLREKGIELMSRVLHFGAGRGDDGVYPDVLVIPSIIELCSLLEVSYSSGAISEMNFVVLKREYENVIELFEKAATRRRETEREGYMIPKNFFDLPYESSLVDLLGVAARTDGTHKNMSPAQNMSDISETAVSAYKGQSVMRSSPIKTAVSLQQHEGVRNPRSKNRRESIVSILRQQGRLGIKDITKVIRGCSEKTVQRELLSLVKEGVVMKEGERRWSVYSLVA